MKPIIFPTLFCGLALVKQTAAHIISKEIKAYFISCNAIDTGAKDLREIGLAAFNRRIQLQEKTLLFIDEIHRLNKSQQDVLLPFTEKGDIILIGATTENPSYDSSQLCSVGGAGSGF